MNLSGVDKLLGGLEGLLDLEVGGLGEDLVDIVTDGIRTRTLEGQRTVDDDELAANRGAYGRRKRAKGIPVGVGLREGKARMLDADEIRGDVSITPTEATMSPGTSELGRIKAGRFEEGDGERQPARPFYGIDDETEERAMDRIERQVEDRLRELAGP